MKEMSELFLCLTKLFKFLKIQPLGKVFFPCIYTTNRFYTYCLSYQTVIIMKSHNNGKTALIKNM